MNSSGTKLPLRVSRTRAGGKNYYYHTATRTRLKGEPGSPGFERAYKIAENAMFRSELAKSGKRAARGAGKNTFGALVAKYRLSQDFLRLAPRTRRDYEEMLHYATPLNHYLLKTSTAARVLDLRDRLENRFGARRANYVVQVVRRVFSWGVERGLAPFNPCRGLKKIPERRNRPANRVWKAHEIEAFEQSAPDQLLVPFSIALYAGLRMGDVLKLKWDDYDGARLVFVQGKTGEPQTTPLPDKLRLLLDRVRNHSNSAFICVTSNSTQWSEGGFRVSFKRHIERLASQNRVGPFLTFHGLRHTAGSRLAELGFSTRAIARYLGHKTLRMAEHYTEQANLEDAVEQCAQKLNF